MDIHKMPLPGCISNSTGQILEANKEFASLLGCTPDDITEKNLVNFVPAGHKQIIFNSIKNCSVNQKKNFEADIKGNNKITKAVINISRIDTNQILVLICDITEFKTTEEKLLNTIIASEEKERRRIAAELHDNLSPILSTIKLYTDLLKKKTSGQASELIHNIEQLSELAISTAKEISYNITPSILHDFGLAEAIKKFADFINKTKSVNITVKRENYHLAKRTMAESILYHAAKELINNTIKHAQADEIIIDLRSTQNKIILYYRDNGKGFSPNEAIKNGNGLGLRNLIHKVNTIKGTCDFFSQPGKGFIAVITVPVQN